MQQVRNIEKNVWWLGNMDECDCYRKQKVDWREFTNCIILVRILIATLSAMLLVCAIISESDIKFLSGCYIFGFILMTEGTIVSFFKVGD